MKKVSGSNTKAEILNAYEALLTVLQEERSHNSSLKRELEKKQQIVAKAKTKDTGNITENISTFRKKLNEQFDEIEQILQDERNRFQELQQAVAIEKETLEDLYKIKIQAESLEALILTNKQAKEKLEKEMLERKTGLQEEIQEIKQGWEREKESYNYQLRISRRNEEDQYKQQKAKQEAELKEQKIAFEKEMAERENNMAEREEEFAALRKASAKFEEQLNKSVAEAEKMITEKLSQEFEYKQQLDTKELDTQIKLHRQEIESLKVKTVDQQAIIDSLGNKSDSAVQQVRDIALKAIENAGLKSLNLSSPKNED